MSSLGQILRRPDVAPILRRFITNTLFDSTFMLLGIIIGSFSASQTHINAVIITMITSSLALGISSGVSVYEAESLEREKSLDELERALFRDLRGTNIEKSSKRITLLTALINFSTPLVTCTVTVLPFVVSALGVLNIAYAFWISIILILAMLFGEGAYLGRYGHKNPLLRGFRMVGFGLIAFFIGFLLNSLI